MRAYSSPPRWNGEKASENAAQTADITTICQRDRNAAATMNGTKYRYANPMKGTTTVSAAAMTAIARKAAMIRRSEFSSSYQGCDLRSFMSFVASMLR